MRAWSRVGLPNAICTNTSGFPLTQPLLGNLGDSGRNQLRLANFVDVDLGVYKDTRVRENVTLQFRWETYNLFNHANFSGFVNTLTSPKLRHVHQHCQRPAHDAVRTQSDF